MTGAESLIRALEREGVEVVFGYPGGAIMPVYDALLDTGIRHVLVRHEQGAALAAGGYARSSGRVGVCLATSGPGATNLLTGIADAFMDSVPLVAITGQVPLPLLGTDAFQEVDIFGMSMPVVKHSVIVRDIADLGEIVAEAFRIARSGRPGPVLIDFPKDLASGPASHFDPARPTTQVSVDPPGAEVLGQAATMISEASRPVVMAGGGIRQAGATDSFRGLVERCGLPTVTTLHGVGALPTDHPLLLGMIGMHGTAAANHAVQESDLLIALGVRFDDRATGRLDGFAPHARVIHLDIDPSEINKLRRVALAIRGDLRVTLPGLLPERPSVDRWRERVGALRVESEPRYDAPGPLVFAPRFIRALTSRDPGSWTVTCDVGQHQMWVAQHGWFTRPEHHLSSGGLGTMGFGIPAAIGAWYANPTRRVVAISGDGSFMMNVQELATIRRYNLPIKIIVLDNQSLGLVRQWQECFFEQRFSEVDLSDNPDFCEVAEAFGIPALRLEREADEREVLDALHASSGPLLVHARIDVRANVWPLVPPSASNDEMIKEVPRCSGM